MVRLHCANPAFGAVCSAIITIFRCHGRPQVALEHKIHGIFADVDQDNKRTEFRSLTTQLYGRLPPRPKSEAKVPDETSADFDKLLGPGIREHRREDPAERRHKCPFLDQRVRSWGRHCRAKRRRGPPEEEQSPGVRLQGDGRFPPLPHRQTSSGTS